MGHGAQTSKVTNLRPTTKYSSSMGTPLFWPSSSVTDMWDDDDQLYPADIAMKPNSIRVIEVLDSGEILHFDSFIFGDISENYSRRKLPV
ncbi:hypothetical protein KC19_2G066400 [Ceratodon purpureus]|uniref:Uncharacterized protein n=1 Tax=Ceratodon purpureus TaxID=3225 RepID=A0A8T0ISP0_CERPU|nr:hypothetical protein KC19_2G066400 [Ceratodon purpureus]